MAELDNEVTFVCGVGSWVQNKGGMAGLVCALIDSGNNRREYTVRYPTNNSSYTVHEEEENITVLTGLGDAVLCFKFFVGDEVVNVHGADGIVKELSYNGEDWKALVAFPSQIAKNEDSAITLFPWHIRDLVHAKERATDGTV